MDNYFSAKLNGRAIHLLTKLKTYEKIENFFNSMNNSNICLILANDMQMVPTTEVASYNNLNLECFTNIFQNRNNIFIFHYYRKPNVYYRCKDCYCTAFFKKGKFREKHLGKCRLKINRTLSKNKREVESYFNSSECNNDVSIDNLVCDSDSFNFANNLITQFSSELVKVHDITANEVTRKSIHTLLPPTQVDSEFLIPSDVEFFRNGKFKCNNNLLVESMNGFGKKHLESKIDKIKMKNRTN